MTRPRRMHPAVAAAIRARRLPAALVLYAVAVGAITRGEEQWWNLGPIELEAPLSPVMVAVAAASVGLTLAVSPYGAPSALRTPNLVRWTAALALAQVTLALGVIAVTGTQALGAVPLAALSAVAVYTGAGLAALSLRAYNLAPMAPLFLMALVLMAYARIGPVGPMEPLVAQRADAVFAVVAVAVLLAAVALHVADPWSALSWRRLR